MRGCSIANFSNRTNKLLRNLLYSIFQPMSVNIPSTEDCCPTYDVAQTSLYKELPSRVSRIPGQ